MATRTAYLDWTPVPTIAITLPLELPPPDGFAPDDLATWPLVEGRLEYVDGKLLYLPPAVDEQQDTVAGATSGRLLVLHLHPWLIGQPFRIGSLDAAPGRIALRQG